MIGRIVIVLAIVGIVIGGLILGEGGPSSTAKPAAEESSEVPGYSARNAELIETGEDGRPAFRVLSPLVRQRPNDDRVQLDSPQITFISAAEGTWHARSRSGLIQADGSNVELFGDVKMEGEHSGAPIAIGTSIMSFDTHEQIASTRAPVAFESQGATLSSTGVVANLKDGTVQLESSVHGTFPPK